MTTPDTAAPQQHPRQPEQGRRRTARRVLVATAAVTVGALALTACGGSANAENADGKNGDTKGKGSSAAQITISAKDGSTGASINATGVKVKSGKLTDVKMTEPDSGETV
ncbi:hypothetical protein ACFC18_47735, partial [Streptomyces sp. NPDC056121]